MWLRLFDRYEKKFTLTLSFVNDHRLKTSGVHCKLMAYSDLTNMNRVKNKCNKRQILAIIHYAEFTLHRECRKMMQLRRRKRVWSTIMNHDYYERAAVIILRK